MAGVGSTSVTVGSGTTAVVALNAKRHSLVITNISGAVVWLSEGQTAAVNQGIPLAPSPDGAGNPGDSYVRARSTVQDGMFVGAVNGIADGTTALVSVGELDFDDQDVFRA